MNREASNTRDEKERQPEYQRSTEIIVGYPNSIEINLVPANELKHYDLFNWLALLVAPISVGFWTAYFTLPDHSKSILWSSSVFSLLAITFIGLEIHYRR